MSASVMEMAVVEEVKDAERAEKLEISQRKARGFFRTSPRDSADVESTVNRKRPAAVCDGEIKCSYDDGRPPRTESARLYEHSRWQPGGVSWTAWRCVKHRSRFECLFSPTLLPGPRGAADSGHPALRQGSSAPAPAHAPCGG